MKIRTFGPHLIQLTKWGVFNCYLVREEQGLTLIDTALSGSGEAILSAAADLGQPITRITLTHAHSDHVGALDEVAGQLPAAEVAFTARTAQFLRGEVTLEPDEPRAKIRGGFDPRQTAPTRLLNPGDRVGSLQVIAAPGHSPDHVAFLDTRDGTLIAGDAFQTQAGIAVAGRLRLLFPFPALATWHKPTALATARRLLDLQPARLAVGHGRVLDQPAPAMQRAIDDAARRFGASHGQEATT
jgi:glyoxylase-like metal-dependent hydrolase (beta-lactamase superfamily II)